MHSTFRTPARRLLSTALVSCLMLAAAPAAMAQSANASLRGQVAGAQAGTEITATNVATGTVRRGTVRADGSYSLMGLDPGTYDVVANGQTQKVTVTVASTATLNFAGAAGSTAGSGATTLDTVNVVAPTLLQEVRTSEVGKTVSLQQIQTTPQVSRNFLEFADAVPGMIFTRDARGNTSLRGGATNADGTNVYIDGVGQKSYVKGGGVAGQSGSAGNPFPQLAIGEYKVISGNYKAEYGQVSSAAVTAATKSGTNEFKGEAFYRYTDEDMRAKTPAERQAGKEKMVSAEKEYGFALGGPIIKDKAHFFVTYEAKRFDLPVTIAPDGAVTGSASLLPPEAAAGLGPASQPFQQDLIFAKIDFEPTDNDRLELTFQDRDESQQRQQSLEHREQDLPGHLHRPVLGTPDQDAQACHGAGGHVDEGVFAEQFAEERDLDQGEQAAPQVQYRPADPGEQGSQGQGQRVLPGVFEQFGIGGAPMAVGEPALQPGQGDEQADRQGDSERGKHRTALQAGRAGGVPAGPGRQRQEQQGQRQRVLPEAPVAQLDHAQGHRRRHGQHQRVPADAAAQPRERPPVQFGAALGQVHQATLQQRDQHDEGADVAGQDRFFTHRRDSWRAWRLWQRTCRAAAPALEWEHDCRRRQPVQPAADRAAGDG